MADIYYDANRNIIKDGFYISILTTSPRYINFDMNGNLVVEAPFLEPMKSDNPISKFYSILTMLAFEPIKDLELYIGKLEELGDIKPLKWMGYKLTQLSQSS